jgi:hypothetical protein
MMSKSEAEEYTRDSYYQGHLVIIFDKEQVVTHKLEKL